MAKLVTNDVQLDVNPKSEGQLLISLPEPEFVEVDDEQLEQLNSGETVEIDVEESEDEIEESTTTEDEDEGKSLKPKGNTKEKTTTSTGEAVDPIVYFGKTLKSSGIFSSVEDEDIESISSLEDLTEIMGKQLESSLEDWKAPAMQNWVDTLINAGYIKPEQVNVGNYLKESDIKTESVAEKFIRHYYNGKLNEKSIQRLIDKSDDIVEEAKSLIPEYNDEQKVLEARAAKELEKVEREREAAKERLYTDIKKNVESFTEFIPGKRINSSTKEKVYNSVGNVWQKINNDAVKYAPILAYLDHYGILDGKFDSITKLAESDANKKFKTLLDSKPIRGTDTSDKKRTNQQVDDEFREAMRMSMKTK